jgi:hypothetical protein
MRLDGLTQTSPLLLKASIVLATKPSLTDSPVEERNEKDRHHSVGVCSLLLVGDRCQA